MPYVTASGTIAETRPLHPVESFFLHLRMAFGRLSTTQKAVACAFLALLSSHFLNPDPLAGGRIPAAAVPLAQHWDTILHDDSFVRTMTSHLGKKNKRKGQEQAMNQHIKNGDLFAMGHVNFGGPDGHEFERMDVTDMESIRGTRCASTQSAITAYFCGADIAENQDMGLGDQRKGSFVGVKSFTNMIVCRHQQGEQNKSHRRSVYRLGIGCQDKLAGYSHAFSIIAQPDGSFYWLQSFIGHYSLTNWVERTDIFGSPLGKLTLDQLVGRLEKVDRLMKISKWSSQANSDYHDLFGVDKNKEAIYRGKPAVRSTWQPTHRLQYFFWDEACEFPVPPTAASGEADEGDAGYKNLNAPNDRDGSSTAGVFIDECMIAAISSSLAGVWKNETDIASNNVKELQKEPSPLSSTAKRA